MSIHSISLRHTHTCISEWQLFWKLVGAASVSTHSRKLHLSVTYPCARSSLFVCVNADRHRERLHQWVLFDEPRTQIGYCIKTWTLLRLRCIEVFIGTAETLPRIPDNATQHATSAQAPRVFQRSENDAILWWSLNSTSECSFLKRGNRSVRCNLTDASTSKSILHRWVPNHRGLHQVSTPCFLRGRLRYIRWVRCACVFFSL